MWFLSFVLYMDSVSFVHFYVNPKLNSDESLESNRLTMKYASNMLRISESKCCVSFSIYQNSCLGIMDIRTDKNISCWYFVWINGNGDKENDIEYKFISQDYNTLIKHGWNKTKLIDGRVVIWNSIYFGEVGQLIFDKIRNIVSMCNYSNKNTSVSIIIGQLIIDTILIISQLSINDLIIDILFKVQMDSLTMEVNRIAIDTLIVSNEYIKRQRELVLNTNISRSSNVTNKVFSDYIVMILKSNLYAILTLTINIKIIDNSNNSNNNISFEYQLCQEFLCKDCIVPMIKNKIRKGMKESKFFEMNIFNIFPTCNIVVLINIYDLIFNDKEFLEKVSIIIIFNSDGDEHTFKTVWELTCITIIRNVIAQLGLIKYNSSVTNKT